MKHTFVLIWSEIPYRGVDSFSIIEACDLLKNLLLGFFPRFEFIQIDELFFQHTMKRLNTSVVVAISLAAHAAGHAILFQALLIV